MRVIKYYCSNTYRLITQAKNCSAVEHFLNMCNKYLISRYKFFRKAVVGTDFANRYSKFLCF